MSPASVVCLHGLGRSARDWDGVRSGLARYGSVDAVALPAGGLRALMAATDDLPARMILIGHSMAGAVALRRAADAPERVTALILTDSFFPPARDGRGLLATARDYAEHRIALARELGTRAARPRPSGAGARGVASLAGLGLRPDAFHTMAGAVRVPVLVVHADDDHHVPVAFARAASARHPTWNLRVLERGGHNAHVDSPSDWLAAVTPWLDALQA